MNEPRRWRLFYKSESNKGWIAAAELNHEEPIPYKNNSVDVVEVLPDSITITREEFDKAVTKTIKDEWAERWLDVRFNDDLWQHLAHENRGQE